MIVQAIKTNPITPSTNDVTQLLEQYMPPLKEGTIVVITSKVVAICEARVVEFAQANKDELVRQESQYFLPRSLNRYNTSLAIVDGRLAPAAGIDESNGNGYFILYPSDPQATANRMREYLAAKHKLQRVGVIMTDSSSRPLEKGVTGVAIAHSGFAELKDYVGQSDIFGRPFAFSKMSVANGLAAAATVVMGEGAECTPLAIIQDVPFVDFQPRNPSPDELAAVALTMQTDLYAELLQQAPWQKGEKA